MIIGENWYFLKGGIMLMFKVIRMLTEIILNYFIK